MSYVQILLITSRVLFSSVIDGWGKNGACVDCVPKILHAVNDSILREDVNRLCVAGQDITFLFNQTVTQTHLKLPGAVEQLLFTFRVINLAIVLLFPFLFFSFQRSFFFFFCYLQSHWSLFSFGFPS